MSDDFIDTFQNDLGACLFDGLVHDVSDIPERSVFEIRFTALGVTFSHDPMSHDTVFATRSTLTQLARFMASDNRAAMKYAQSIIDDNPREGSTSERLSSPPTSTELLELLEEIEWGGCCADNGAHCPYCLSVRGQEEHSSACALAKALGRPMQPPEPPRISDPTGWIRCTCCGRKVESLAAARELCPSPPHGTVAKPGEPCIGHTLSTAAYIALRALE